MYCVSTGQMETIFGYDLYSFMRDYPDLREVVFSFLCRYEGEKFLLRQLSKSFNHLSLYTRLSIRKQSRAFLYRFLKTHQIHTLVMNQHNRNLYKLPNTVFSYMRKLIICSLEEKEFYICCNFFSRCQKIKNLKIIYYEYTIPLVVLRFSRLATLDICITRKTNEDIVFQLLHINKTTLGKLKIGIYTGYDIDERQLQTIIEDELRLEYLGLRGDLVTPKMIKPCTRYIRHIITYAPESVYRLSYLIKLRVKDVSNTSLSILCRNLYIVEELSVWGVLSNYRHMTADHPHADDFLVNTDRMDLSVPYDNTTANVVISSRLSSLFLYGFTVCDFDVGNSITRLMVEDVCFKQPVYLPSLYSLYIDNMMIDPKDFSIYIFKTPRVRQVSILRCLVREFFVFNAMRSLNMQHCKISIDMEHIIRKHKNLRDVLFYVNTWERDFRIETFTRLLKARRIEHHDSTEWIATP